MIIDYRVAGIETDPPPFENLIRTVERFAQKRIELVQDRVVSVNRSPQKLILKITNPHLMINVTKDYLYQNLDHQ